jgi:hypothetical protein
MPLGIRRNFHRRPGGPDSGFRKELSDFRKICLTPISNQNNVRPFHPNRGAGRHETREGMRWTLLVPHGVRHERGRQMRVVLTPEWQVLSLVKRFTGDGDKKAGLAGESTKELVNTIAQGMPVDPAKPVVTAACFFCCRRAMGEVVTRHSLRPLFFPGAVDAMTRAKHVAGMRWCVFTSTVIARLVRNCALGRAIQ